MFFNRTLLDGGFKLSRKRNILFVFSYTENNTVVVKMCVKCAQILDDRKDKER